MLMKSSDLRRYIRCVVIEALEGPHIWDRAKGNFIDREQIGSLADKQDGELADHLVEPELDPEDLYGPVPPVQGEPNVSADPFTRDYHVIPTRPVYRGR